METSDWVLVFSTLFLGACALFVPYVAEMIKRRLFSPAIKIRFQLLPPFCHKTRMGTPSHPLGGPQIDQPVYYFRFLVINEGKSRANNCEICLENLWIYDASQTPRLHPNFSTVNMAWSGNHKNQFVNINPDRKMYADIGHISSKEFQNKYEQQNFIDIREDSGNGLRFMLELPRYFYSQPNCLVAGRYILEIRFYCENAKNQKIYFDISWTGKWEDKEDEMFKEIVIGRTSKPKNDRKLGAGRC